MMTIYQSDKIGGGNMRKQGQSQEEYCKGCILNIACNVILEDDESCGDMATEDERDFAIASGDFSVQGK